MSRDSLRHFRTLQLAEVNTTGAVGERFLAILVAHHTRHFELATCPVCLGHAIGIQSQPVLIWYRLKIHRHKKLQSLKNIKCIRHARL